MDVYWAAAVSDHQKQHRSSRSWLLMASCMLCHGCISKHVPSSHFQSLLHLTKVPNWFHFQDSILVTTQFVLNLRKVVSSLLLASKCALDPLWSQRRGWTRLLHPPSMTPPAHSERLRSVPSLSRAGTLSLLRLSVSQNNLPLLFYSMSIPQGVTNSSQQAMDRKDSALPTWV